MDEMMKAYQEHAATCTKPIATCYPCMTVYDLRPANITAPKPRIDYHLCNGVHPCDHDDDEHCDACGNAIGCIVGDGPRSNTIIYICTIDGVDGEYCEDCAHTAVQMMMGTS